MTGKKRDRDRTWTPFVRAENVVPDALWRAAVRDPRVGREMGRFKETWANNRFVVRVARAPEGHVISLSIRRVDRGHQRDWRELQRIKNALKRQIKRLGGVKA